MRLILIALALIAGLVPSAPAQVQSDVAAGFRRFLERDIWPAAARRGVPRAVFDAAFKGVAPNLKLPDLQLPGDEAKVEEKQRQAEFQSPSAYFDEAKIAGVAAKGRALLAQNKALLARIEASTGVPGPIVLAIWGRESGFGAAKIPYNAFEVLGTKAYLSRRKEMFRDELLAALDIVASGQVAVSDMRSSWAGALGQPQFMPSKFRERAVDFDGDGHPDIWNSVPDTLASIAHYLQQAGWTKGRGWGFEARVPATVSCAIEGPDRSRPISELAARGVTPITGRLSAGEARAPGNLLMPAGRSGPAFVATPNFYVLKAYNNSDLYALFIANLADRIAGDGKAFSGGWTKIAGMTRGDVARMQERLVKRGYDVGGTDGLPGFKTRRAIGEFETKEGLPATCWPSPTVARRLGSAANP